MAAKKKNGIRKMPTVKTVPEGKKMATSGGAGKATRRVPSEQASMQFIKMTKKRKKAAL